jgi:hypothetical protein
MIAQLASSPILMDIEGPPEAVKLSKYGLSADVQVESCGPVRGGEDGNVFVVRAIK